MTVSPESAQPASTPDSSVLDTSVRDVNLNTGRLVLAAREWGHRDGKRVLAVHGWLDNAASFDPLFAHFSAQDFHIVALDLAGHGWSQHRPAGENYHFLDNVVDIVAAMDELGWNDCVLLGHSMGGALAMLLAAAFPERVTALVLIDALGPLVNMDNDVAAQLRKAVERHRAGPGAGPVYKAREDAIRARQRGIGALSAEAATLIAVRNLTEADGGYSWRTDPRLRWPSLQRLSEGQVRAALAEIRCPSLLVAGTEGFVKSSHRVVTERLGQIAGLQIKYVQGAHHLHMEPSPQIVAETIEGFLAQLPRGRD